MKSVVFIITTLRRTGPVNILFDLVKYLDRSVYQPHVITLCEEEGDSRWGEFEALGVTLTGLRLLRGWRFIAESARVRAAVDRIRPDIVHCFGFRADLLGMLLLGRYRKVSSQLNYPFDDYVMTYGRLVGGLMARLTAWSLRRFDATVACANDVAAKMRRRGVLAEVIYNAIDDARFVPPEPQEIAALRAELKLWPDTDLVFIFVGVLSDRKQPLVAVDAFARFQRSHPKAALLVLGDGPQAEECRCHADGVRVMFFGNVPDTRPYLAAADVYVATSKAEGMPVSVLEAMALRLPVVLSDIEPHREILAVDPGAGVLAATGSTDDTAAAMLRLVQQDLNIMGEHARHAIDTELNARVMSQKFQAVYARVSA